MAKTSVLIMGGGLAGLAAGWTLLKNSGGRLDVTILEKENVVGGRASSEVKNDGGTLRATEHGLHFFFDYPNFGALLDEIDPSLRKRLRPAAAGAVFYNGDNQDPIRVKPINLPSPFHLLGGLSLLRFTRYDLFATMRLALAALLFQPEKLTPRERRRLDQMGFDDFAAGLGVSKMTTLSPFFQTSARSTFNEPFPPSAYAMLRTLRLVQQNFQAQMTCFTDGTTGDVLVEPLRRAFLALGGKIETGVTVTELLGSTTSIDSVRATGGSAAVNASVAVDLAAAGGDRRASYYVSAMSPGALNPLLPKAVQELPYFSLTDELTLRMNTTVACQLHYDEVVTHPYENATFLGLPAQLPPDSRVQPFSTVIDRAGTWSKGDGRGSVLQLVGDLGLARTAQPGGDSRGWSELTEAEFETEVTALAIRLVALIYPRARGKKPVFTWVRRGRPGVGTGGATASQVAVADYVRTFTDSDRYRPGVATPIENLYLAGDYTAHSFGCVGMEGAVVSGMEAANHILAREALPKRKMKPMSEPGGAVSGIRKALKYTGLFRRMVGYRETP